MSFPEGDRPHDPYYYSDKSESTPSFGIDEEKPLVSLETDFINAKSFLMQCGETNDSVWTHLSELLKKIIEERPTNVIDYFEEYSRRLKEERFATVNEHLRDIFFPPKNLESVKKRILLLKSVTVKPEEYAPPADVPPTGEGEEETAAGPRKMGFLEQMNFFREAGIGLPSEECYAINLALRILSQTVPVKSNRFWGKIFGLKADYIVAECELTEEELNRRLEEEEKGAAEAAKLAEEKYAAEQQSLEAEALAIAEAASQKEKEKAERAAARAAAGLEGEENEEPVSLRDIYKMPPLPEPVAKVEIVTLKEKDNEGVNKKVYYVCHEPGDEWIMLPNLLPLHIVRARQIKKYFTGELDTVIKSFPEFDGTEREYLRAQIARISAGSQISPLGYFTFNEPGEEEEVGEEEEEEVKSTCVENPEFEPLSMKDLLDPTMAFWVHHTQHILKQGRTKWWSSQPPKGEEEAEEEEEEEGAAEKETPEVGPPLLTPLSEDVSLETIAPWTVRNTSVYTPENAMAFVSSNLWPGAYAFAIGKTFGNIYLGSGHKYSGHGYSPLPLPFPENEYEIGPEIMEIEDPTPQQEEEWRLAHEKKPPVSEGEEEAEEEEAEEEEA